VIIVKISLITTSKETFEGVVILLCVRSLTSLMTFHMILMSRALEKRAHEKYAPAPENLLFSMNTCHHLHEKRRYPIVSQRKIFPFPIVVLHAVAEATVIPGAQGGGVLHRHQPRTRHDFLPRQSMHLSSIRHLLGSEHRLLSGFQAFGDSRSRAGKTECTLL
jgi:hypothetical protein